MDYKFTASEELLVYGDIKKLWLAETTAKSSGVLKGRTSAIKMYRTILDKMEVVSPKLKNLPIS